MRLKCSTSTCWKSWRDTRKGTGSKVKWRTDDLDSLIRQAVEDDE